MFVFKTKLFFQVRFKENFNLAPCPSESTVAYFKVLTFRAMLLRCFFP